MGLPQRIGTLLAQGFQLGTVKTPKERLVLSINGWEHNVEYVTPWVGMEGLIPNRFSKDPKYPGLFLMDGDSEKWMGNLARITLVYKTPDYPITDTSGTPPDEFNESPSAQTESIVLNSRFSNTTFFPVAQQIWRALNGELTTPSVTPTDGSTFEQFAGTSPDVGQNDFYQGVKTVVHVKYYPRLSATLTDTTIQPQPDPSGYVVIADPPVDAYTTAGNFLRLTSEVNPAGLWWTRKDTYLFRATAWSANAYATG